MSDMWGPWIEHDGKGCPCVGQYVQAQGHIKDWGNIVTQDGIANSNQPSWSLVSIIHGPCVIRYRIRKPKGLTMLETILNELHAPVKQRELTE